MRIQSEKYKVRNKVEKVKFLGPGTKGIKVLLEILIAQVKG